jgi:hypothetical protein
VFEPEIITRRNPLVFEPEVIKRSGRGWAFGYSLDVSLIGPLSGGGGSFGINPEYTSGEGFDLYIHATPQKEPSVGFQFGVSLQPNIAFGSGPWTGLFDVYSGGITYYGGSYFQSSDISSGNDLGYRGVSVGVGLGWPPISGGITRTNYERLAEFLDPNRGSREGYAQAFHAVAEARRKALTPIVTPYPLVQITKGIVI